MTGVKIFSIALVLAWYCIAILDPWYCIVLVLYCSKKASVVHPCNQCSYEENQWKPKLTISEPKLENFSEQSKFSDFSNQYKLKPKL